MRRAIPYTLLVMAVMILGLLGYGGFALYTQTNLVDRVSLLIFALAAGTASFFSPCSFSLIVALLARQTGYKTQPTGRTATIRGLAFAGALAVGASAFLVLVGLVLAVGQATVFASVSFTAVSGRVLRLITGAVLIVLGLMQLGFLANILAGAVNLVSPLIRWQARYRQQKPALAFLVLGYAWPLAGFGWTGPILAGLAGHALTSAGSFGAVITFTVASSTIVLLIFFLTLAIAMTQDALVNRMRIHTHSIKRWGGRILVGLGTWLVMLAVFADFFARVFSL